MIRWSLGLVGALALLSGCEAASAACDPQAASNVNATCSGTTSNQAGGAPGTSGGLNGYGTGIETNLGVTVLSNATVTGTIRGVFFDTGTLFNSGAVSGGSFGIIANTTATVTNSGTIFSGGNSGIRANIATVTNSGTISGGVFGIFGINTATVTNSGTIRGGSSGIEADTATVTNSGTISSGGSFGIHATNTATVTNFGAISGFYGVYGPTVTVTNFGTIVGNNAAIAVLSSGTVINSGTVSGANFGLLANGGVNVINSGAIIGGGTAALELSGAADTLTLLPGSRIIGAINLIGGGDTVNFHGGNHNLTFDTLAGATVTGTTPFAVFGNQAAAIDPTPFAAAGALLTDFTRGVSSLVPMFGQATPAAGGAAMAFAAPAAGSPIEETFAGIPGLSAYAADRAVFKNPKVLYADGTAIWAGGFAGERIQQADGVLLHNTNRYYGGALGGEKQIRPDLRLGAFIGGGSTRTSIDFNYGGTDSDLGFAGAYARYLSGAWFLQTGLQGGISRNTSTRNINNNLVAAGIETATAGYDGWYLSPEATIGQRLVLGPILGAQHSLTPSVQVRYLYGLFGGYTETGSTANLTVGSRTVENFEERAQLKLTRTQPWSATSVLLINLTGGALGVQRVGGDTINAALLGQAIPFATPGRADAWGGFGGVGIELRNGSMAVFAAGEYLALTDSSSVVSGKGGVRIAF